jgi:hypothetical protein
MKKRIIVCKKPNENEIQCEHCNKIMEAGKYKTHLRLIHEIGLKKVTKKNEIKDVMGISHSQDYGLMVKQNEFEQKLTVLCPFCSQTIVNKSLKNHLSEHDDISIVKINNVLVQNSIPIICPICLITVVPPLRKHLRKVHYMELDTFAEGIYETDRTIRMRIENQKKAEEGMKFNNP